MSVVMDLWGEPLTVREGAGDVAMRFDALMAGYLQFARDLPQRLVTALQGDDIPLARCVQGYFLLMAHRAEATTAAAAVHKDLAARSDLTTREQGHVAALGHWVQGQSLAAVDCWDEVLDGHPRDLLAIRLGHFVLFNQRQLSRMRDILARTASSFSPSVPFASYVAGMTAFAAEESGEYAMAEALGLAAVAQDPADLWAVHAVAHVLEMQGRFEDGVGWLSERVELSKAGSFANHLFWHEALYRLELGRTAEVLYLFDSHVYANSSEEGLDLSNAVSLLARLEIVGVDAGDRWNRLAGPCAARLAQHSHPFNDAHFALALARSGSTDTLARLLGSMAEWAERDTDAARTLRRCGLSVALGMAAYGEGRFAEAVQVLAPVRYETWQLGGSLAQLDVFAQILIAAAVGAGQLTLAARLLAERTARRPASPLGWVWEAQVSGRIGDEERAARATERAARLR